MKNKNRKKGLLPWLTALRSQAGKNAEREREINHYSHTKPDQ
jgi:hypothetical protein